METSFERQQKILHSPFDYRTHANTFIHYCEILILEDGKCVYAIPSHQEKLIELFADKHKITIDEAKDYLREKIDYMDELLRSLHCVVVWYDSIYYLGNLNDNQKYAISQLIAYGCVDDKVLSEVR